MSGAAADWHSAAAYEPLHHCDRAMFAWEWLRRDVALRAVLENGGGDDIARAFGLVRLEHPDVTVPEARPIWSADIDPSVLVALAEPSAGDDAFDLRRFEGLASCTATDSHEHVLLSDGYQSVRLDLPTGALDGPVRLRWQLAGLASAAMPIDALQRLIFLHETGRFPARISPTADRARRWAMLLRVFDALLDGASAREIAETLYGPDAAGPRWRIADAAWRARVQRLIAAARNLAAAGPSAILAGTVPAAGGRRLLD